MVKKISLGSVILKVRVRHNKMCIPIYEFSFVLEKDFRSVGRSFVHLISFIIKFFRLFSQV